MYVARRPAQTIRPIQAVRPVPSAPSYPHTPYTWNPYTWNGIRGVRPVVLDRFASVRFASVRFDLPHNKRQGQVRKQVFR